MDECHKYEELDWNVPLLLFIIFSWTLYKFRQTARQTKPNVKGGIFWLDLWIPEHNNRPFIRRISDPDKQVEKKVTK